LDVSAPCTKGSPRSLSDPFTHVRMVGFYATFELTLERTSFFRGDEIE
jgi:hypothetical protein